VVKKDKQTEYSRIYYKEDVSDKSLEKAIKKLPFLQVFLKT